MASTVAEKKTRSLFFYPLARLASLIWWLLLVAVIVLALYVGLGRQLTQNINDYRPNIEQLLSSELGQGVRIGSLSSSWNWLNPTFIARDIVVLSHEDGEGAAGSLQSMRIGLDFLSSLRRLRIVFADFEADGLELTINQTRRGEVTVEGVDIPEPMVNDLERWLEIAGTWLSDPSVRITRLDLGIRDANNQVRRIEVPQLDLDYQRGRFHASGRAMSPGTTRQLASFELVGRHFFRGGFTGQIHARINSGRLFDGLIEEYGWRGLRVEGFDLGGQVWMTFRDGLLEQINGTVTTPYLQIGASNESLAPLENIQARFGWRRQQASGDPQQEASRDSPQEPWYTRGEYHLQGLQWRWNGDPVPPFSVRFLPRPSGPRIIADGLPVQPLAQLAAGIGLLPERATRALENYRPEGTLNQLLLELASAPDSGFELSALMEDVAVRAHRGAPGVSGLDGRLVINNQGGYVDARSDAVTLGFPDLFRGYWDLTEFNAGVAFRFDGNLTRVYSEDIRMIHGAGTELKGAFDLRLDQQAEDNLGLRVGVSNGTAAMLADFVPRQLVNPDLYQWLTTAIEQASIPSGSFYGHGTIDRDAPPGSFSTSMVYRFQDATLRYDQRWPAVTDASGNVTVHNGRTRVDLESGRTGGLELDPGQVIVTPEAEVPRVYVDAAAMIPGSALTYWLENSPLGELAGEAGRQIRLAGNYHLALDLGLPLDSDLPPDISARIRADGGTLTYPSADLEWTGINGELDFSTAGGFSEEFLQASFMGAPVRVQLGRETAGGPVSIRQTGRLDIRNLLAKTGLPEGATLGLSGDIGYQATLDVAPDNASAVTLTSDLSGLAVNWPEPLAKNADASTPMTARLQPGDTGGLDVSVDWQDRLNMDLMWQPDSLALSLGRLNLGGQTLTDLNVSASRGDGRWAVDAESDWLSGQLEWPGDNSPVTVDLAWLRLARGGDGVEEAIPPLPEPEVQIRAFRALAMENWPDMDLRIDSLQLDDDDAGAWSLRFRPQASELRLEAITGQLQSLALNGELVWGIGSGRETSRFRGDLRGGSLEELSNLVGSDVPFESESTAVEMDLDWPGRPNDFDLAALSGSVSARFDDGVILEGNSTAQLFRVFNLLNSDTLWRRLKLDFSDLYEAGVAFDAISGRARMSDGLLTLDPELEVVGPSGAFKLSGTSNMNEESLDMQMVVVLPLTQNLPLAALLMGAGAPIGGALFVLDKVLGDPLSKLTSATYSVTGRWDEPKVRLKRVFDTGQ